jgi:hypothetical protein
MVLVVELASGRLLRILEEESQTRFKEHLDHGYPFLAVDTDARREKLNRQGIVTYWFEEPAPPAVETAPTAEAPPPEPVPTAKVREPSPGEVVPTKAKPARSFFGRVARRVLGGEQL